MILDRLTNVVYIVCLIVIILFAIVFIAIAAFYFNAKKDLYNHKFEDPKVQKDVDKYCEKMVKKQKSNEDLYNTAEREKKRSKTLTTIWSWFLTAVYIVILAFLGWGAVNRAQGNLNFVNNVAPLVIETSSMESVNTSNQQYIDQNGLSGQENRIEQFAYITISNEQSVIDSIALYDIVAFRYPVVRNGENVDITVVHRLISQREQDGQTLYTFRGDANPGSLQNEIDVTKDRIIGVYKSANYQGSYNLGFGYFVVYIQSSIGITTVAVAFLLLVIYAFLFEGVTACYDKRFLALLEAKFKALADGSANKIATESIRKDGADFIAVAPTMGGCSFQQKSPLKKNKPGMYLSDRNISHPLTLHQSVYQMDEYLYSGSVENGSVEFELIKPIPERKKPNYGYTFEGIADKIFRVDNALRCWHDEQGRGFVYIKENSELVFIGDKDKKYDIYVRLFDNEFNVDNDRWIVVYAQEAKV